MMLPAARSLAGHASRGRWRRSAQQGISRQPPEGQPQQVMTRRKGSLRTGTAGRPGLVLRFYSRPAGLARDPGHCRVRLGAACWYSADGISPRCGFDAADDRRAVGSPKAPAWTSSGSGPMARSETERAEGGRHQVSVCGAPAVLGWPPAICRTATIRGWNGNARRGDGLQRAKVARQTAGLRFQSVDRRSSGGGT